MIEYARYLGIEIQHDMAYYYDLAVEGLKAPLPENWTACKTHEGEIYYYNRNTKVSQWEHPLDELYRQRLQTLHKQREAKVNPAFITPDKPHPLQQPF